MRFSSLQYFFNQINYLKFFFYLFLILFSSKGWSDINIDVQDIGTEEITQPSQRTPYNFNTYFDYISPSKISKGFFKKDKVHFAEAAVEAGMTVYYCPAYTEGAQIGLGYTATHLRWDGNPWFEQDHFDNVNLIFTGFTKRLNQWFWRAQFTINIDAREWSAPYMSYDAVLWGRYTYSKYVGVHLGLLIQTGLRLDRLYPIIGFDLQLSKKWKLSLVFPVNISLIYQFTPKWSFAIAGRNFLSRFRVHCNQVFPKSLVRYTNVGAEFAIRYNMNNMSANIHAGTTFGGNFRVSNRKNHHAHNYRLEPSSYVGGEMDVSF